MSEPHVRLVKLGGVVARKGDRVMCPNELCRVPIATFRCELLAGAPSIGLDVFRFTEGQNRIAGDGATCRVCATPFMRDEVCAGVSASFVRRKFFTQSGWVAYELPHVKAGPEVLHVRA